MPTDAGPQILSTRSGATAREGFRARVGPAVVGLACVAGGLATRKLLPQGTLVWQYGALVLWCWVVFACVRFVAPRWSVPLAAVWMLAISLAVELAQLTPGPAWISSHHPLLRLVFGEVFSVWDLVAIVCAYAILLLVWRVSRRNPA